MVKFKWETEFKETEIGEIPKDWEVKKVEDMAEVSGGTTPSTKKKEYWDGDVPWITPKDLAEYDYRYITRGERNISKKAVEECSMRIYPPGTILLTSRAPIGYVAIAKTHLTTNQGFRNIIPKDNKISSEYLYYLFKKMKNYLENIAGGSTFPELSGSTLKQVKIPYPPPQEQHRIATILSWFDDLIENKRRQNEILENMAMAIFKSWFIDFEPFQDEEFVYSEELDMEIPKGWEVKPIGEIAEITKGISYKSDEISDTKETKEYVVFITLKCFKRGGGFRPEYKYYLPTAKSRTKNVSVTDGDLIIGITDMTPDAKVVGAPALVVIPPWENSGMISLDCAKIQTDSYLKEYLYLFLKLTQQENSTFANGVNVLHLNTKLFEQSKYVLLPPKPILDRFHSLVEPLFKKIILNEKEIMLLKKARDTLLPQLVFGRLRVVEI